MRQSGKGVIPLFSFKLNFLDVLISFILLDMKPKSFLVTIVAILVFINIAHAQDFYNDYKKYLLRSSSKNAKPFKHLKRVDSIVKWTRLIINKQKEKIKLICSARTLFTL